MANSTEYSMLFKLSAQLGREFGTTFNTAKRTLTDTQKEINALNQAQADISAYQKQQRAVENTSRKMSDLQKEYDNIQREIQETEGFSSRLENKLIEKQRAIDKASDSLRNQTDKLRQMEGAMRDAGIDTEHLADESAKLTDKLDKLANKQAKAAQEAQNFCAEGVSSFEAVGSALVAAGIAAGLKAIYDGYRECISIAADFEETMSTVEALSGATANEMQSLTGFAKELGATTQFTAKESAEAMTFMGMAGWDAQEMMSGMNGVLTLAAASGEDLAMTSDIVTDNLTAFGLTAADTAHFSDVLALAANATNTSVALMGETFKNSAALAGALQYSVEDVALAVGLMANAGIKGSHAGIALKNIFNGLLNGVKLSAAAFGEAEYSAIKADGTMRSFGETLQDLRGYFDQMTGAEKVQNAKLIAGERAMAGFVSIMNATEDDYKSLTEAINNCAGSAQKMADIKMDNLNGQLTLLNSAADAVKTTIGESFNAELRALAKIGTDILTELNEFFEKNPILLKSLIAITAEVGALVLAYSGFVAAKKVMNTVRALSTVLHAKETAAKAADTAATTAQAAATGAAAAAQTALNTAMMANPIGLVVGIVIAAVAALTAGTIAVVELIKKQKSETEELTAASRAEYEQLRELEAEYAEISEQYGAASYQAQELKWQIDELSRAYEEDKRTLAEYQAEYAAVMQAHDEMIQHIRKEEQAVDLECAGILSLVGRLESLSTQSTMTVSDQQEILAIIKALNQEIPGLSLNYDALTNSMSQGIEAVKKLAEAEVNRRKHEQSYEDMVKFMQDNIALENQKTRALQEQKAAQDEVNRAQAEFDAAVERQKEATKAYGGIPAGEAAGRKYANYILPYANAVENAQKTLEKAIKLKKQHDGEIDDASRKIAENEKLINELAEGIAGLGAAADESAESITANAQAMAKALTAVKSGYMDAHQAAALYGLSAADVQNAVDANTQYLDKLEAALQAVEGHYLTADEAAKAYGVTVEALDAGGKILTVIDALEKLKENYSAAYDAAYTSVKGQYDLWDEAEVVIATDIGTINTALETQLSYWSDYNTDLAELLARADDIDGLAEVIASFADGSAASVNAIAGMAAASDQDLSKMVGSWQEVKEQQNEAAESVAELSTGFSNELGSMKSELEDAVSALNLNDEAAIAAKDTVDAYARAIRDGTEDAVAAAAALRAQVAAALMDQPAPSSVKPPRGKSPVYHGPVNPRMGGPQLWEPYAEGTFSAKSGLALVGENGPELVSFRGGEQVLTAEETREYTQLIALLPAFIRAAENRPGLSALTDSGRHVVITIAPSFTVEGGGDDLEGRLRAYSNELKGEIFDALDEAGIDAKRGVYA